MPHQAIPSTRFHANDYAPDEQFEAWRERISVIFNVAPLEKPSAGFMAEAEAYHLGELVWVRTRFDAQRFLRTPRQLRADWLDHYLVQFYRDGGYTGDAGGGELAIRPGSVSVLDLARPVHTRATPAECISLVVPRDVMDRLLPGVGGLHGRVLESGAAGLLADHMASLQHRLPALVTAQAPHVARATGELLAACLLPTAGNLDQARAEIEALQLSRIRDYIDRQLASPALSADDICTAVGLSRSNLYQLFKPHGGVRHYIQERRLLRVHAALADPLETRSIMALATDNGFSSHAHLSRAFRQRFGYSPSDVRQHPASALHRRSAMLDNVAHGHEAPGFDDWVRTLRT